MVLKGHRNGHGGVVCESESLLFASLFLFFASLFLFFASASLSASVSVSNSLLLQILGDPTVQFVVGKLGEVLWSYTEGHRLSTAYTTSGVKGYIVTPDISDAEKDEWSAIKWSQRVHQFLDLLKHSAENVLKAAEREAKVYGGNEIGVDDVEEVYFNQKKTETNMWLLATNIGYDRDHDFTSETLKGIQNRSPRHRGKSDKSLISRVVQHTLDRKLTYAEWALLYNVLRMEPDCTFLKPFDTGVMGEPQQFIKSNPEYQKATLLYDPTKKTRMGPSIPTPTSLSTKTKLGQSRPLLALKV